MNNEKNEFSQYECETSVVVTTTANRDLFFPRLDEETVPILVS